MLQIVKNYVIIFIIPFFVGVTVRALCRRRNKSYFVTVAFAVLAVLGWIAALVIPSHGSELYVLTAVQATMAAVGASLTELVLLAQRAIHRKRNKERNGSLKIK